MDKKLQNILSSYKAKYFTAGFDKDSTFTILWENKAKYDTIIL